MEVGGDTNGIFLGINEISVLLQDEKGKRLLQAVLDSGKEVKIVIRSGKLKPLQKTIKDTINSLKSYLEKEARSASLMRRVEAQELLYELENDEEKRREIIEDIKYEYKHLDRYAREVIVFRKPYHKIDHILKWMNTFQQEYTQGSSTCKWRYCEWYKWKQYRQKHLNFSSIYKEARRICQFLGIKVKE